MRRILSAKFVIAVLIGSAVLISSGVQGEETESSELKSPPNRTDDESPRSLLKKHFDRHSPPLGSALPADRALDADGNEFSLSDLKGHYTVIVSGCLT